MDRRKLVVAIVGAVGLSLMISPADAATTSVTAQPAPASVLLVHPCTQPVNAVHDALRAAARALAAHAVVLRQEALRIHRPAPLVTDVDVTAVNTALGGSATAVTSAWRAADVDVTALNTGVAGTAVAVADVHRARNVDVTAVNTATLGTAVAVADVHRAADVDVTAVNTATLGTAVAVATPSPAPAKHSTRDTSSNVTAVNTGILGTAVAVGGGGSGDVTAVNTGILGTAIAVGGGGPAYPVAY